MSQPTTTTSRFTRLTTLLLGLLLMSSWARTQDAVSFLKSNEVARGTTFRPTDVSAEQSFTFARNLIFFTASVDGETGNFILDTGAPTLLLNNRGTTEGRAPATGVASGGAVSLMNQRVESFRMAGREHGRSWALSLDLRSMEKRMDRTIDGFVGHEFLRGGELRIDYPNRTFQLLKSLRQARHEGREPLAEFRFEYVDHLPVITLKVNGRKLRLAIDTGAGANLIDARHADSFTATERKMNLQGLDGANAEHDIVSMTQSRELALPVPIDFVSFNLDHLQTPGALTIDGLLGSAFLANYCVGIDYRRRKLYLWSPTHIQP